MTDFLDSRPNVGDTNLRDSLAANPAAGLPLITAYRMDVTASRVEQYLRMRDRALAAEGKHAKLLTALKGHESALKKLGEENK